MFLLVKKTYCNKFATVLTSIQFKKRQFILLWFYRLLCLYNECTILMLIKSYIQAVVRHTIEIVYLSLHQQFIVIINLQCFYTMTHFVQLSQFTCYVAFCEQGIERYKVFVTDFCPSCLIFSRYVGCWQQLFALANTSNNLYLTKGCACKVRDKLFQFVLTFQLLSPTYLGRFIWVCIGESCRRCSKAYILGILAKCYHYSSQKHCQFCGSCSCIGMCFIDGYPSERLLFRIHHFLVSLAQQDVFQHSWVGKYNTWRALSYCSTSINHIRVLVLHFTCLFINILTTDLSYLSTHLFCFLCLVTWRWFFLWQISIIHGIFDASTCKHFLQTFLLVFHQGIERIKEQCLYLSFNIMCGIILNEVLNQRHHKTLRLTRACTSRNTD